MLLEDFAVAGKRSRLNAMANQLLPMLGILFNCDVRRNRGAEPLAGFWSYLIAEGVSITLPVKGSPAPYSCSVAPINYILAPPLAHTGHLVLRLFVSRV